MITLSATLTAAQKAMGDILYAVLLTKAGSTTYAYGFGSPSGTATTNRILDLRHIRYDPWIETAIVVIENRDNAVPATLIGYTATVGYGYHTSAGDEFSGRPLKVISQQFSSSPGELTCTLILAGLGNQLAQDKASMINKTGAATSTSSGNLVDTNQTFETGDVGKTVHNTTDDTYAKITAFTSATQVALDTNIMASGEDYDVFAPMYEPLSTLTYKDLIVALAGATMPCFNHCAAVTVDWDVEDWIIDDYEPSTGFRVYEGEDRLGKLKELLSYTGCDGRIGADDHIHIFMTYPRAWQADFNYYEGEIVKPTTGGEIFFTCTKTGVSDGTEPTWPTAVDGTVNDNSTTWKLKYDYTYDLTDAGHNFFDKSTRTRIITPSKITVHTDPYAATQYSGSATDAASYTLLPKEEFKVMPIGSDAEGQALAEAMIDRLRRESSTGYGHVPINIGQEVLDWVLITDSRQSDVARGRIQNISMHCRPDRFDMNFSFETFSPKALMTETMRNLSYGEPIPEWAKGITDHMESIDTWIMAAIEGINAILATYRTLIDYLGDSAGTSKQTVVTASRAFGTVYQNTSGKIMEVVVSIGATLDQNASNQNAYADASCDANASPSTLIARAGFLLATTTTGNYPQAVFSMTFKVPLNYYYKVAELEAGGGVVTLVAWIEYQIH